MGLGWMLSLGQRSTGVGWLAGDLGCIVWLALAFWLVSLVRAAAEPSDVWLLAPG